VSAHSSLPLQLDGALAATFMAPVLVAVLVMMSFFVLVSELPQLESPVQALPQSSLCT
jgi:hypothetical protein